MLLRKIIIIVLASLVFVSSVNSQELIKADTKTQKLNAVKKTALNKDNPNNKLGYKIQQLMGSPTQSNVISRSNGLATKEQSKVQVYVKVKKLDQTELSQLEKLGFQVEISNEKLNKIQGWVSLNNINSLINLDNVISVTSPVYGHTKAGSRTTEGDAILRSNVLRNQGITGEGVRVGIISDGSNGLASAQASGDLPSNVTLFSSCVNSPTNCSEGTAMAEIIHDIAPDAELAIADALSTSLEFIQRLDQLANDFNADIIVDDLGFFGEPYFEDGDIAQAVTDLPENVVYVSAAGNSGEQHYEGTFDRQLTFFFDSTANIHDFGFLRDLDGNIVTSGALPITIFPSAGGESCVFLQWNDPFVNGGFSTSGNDYDLFIFDSDDDFDVETLVDFSTSLNNTIEAVCVDNPLVTTTYYVVVQQFSGQDRELEIFMTGTAFPGQPVFLSGTQPGPAGSVFGHPATERAIAVGTINASEPGNNQIASFSSQGPSLISFPAQETRAKPDITGIDGVSVTGAAGFPSTFFGTSAAAPHIAGIAALLKSARPNASVDEVREALMNGAVDLGPTGIDNIYGAGRANAENSLELFPNINSDTGNDILDFLPAIIAAANSGNSESVEPENNTPLQLSLSNGFVLNRNGQIGDDVDWVIEKSDEIVLIRNAQNELTYQHIDDSLGASYRIWLRGLVDGQYQTVSNVITYNVPTSYPNTLVVDSNFNVTRTGNFDETVTLVALEDGVEIFRQDVPGFFSYSPFRARLGSTYTVFLERQNNNLRQKVSNTIYFLYEFEF